MSSVREFLKQHLPPEVYQSARFWWWNLKFFVPRRSASLVVKRTPCVDGFPEARASELLRQLRRVNTFCPTRMCRVMSRYGSDKGQGKHNYTTVYSELFGAWRDRPLRIFELGMGTNKPHLASTMGTDARPGASIRGWRDLFPHALVYGADIDRDILFQDDRIQTFYCDQLDQNAIRELWSQPVFDAGLDILIEDGLHTFDANISFLNGSLSLLRPGGVYVIEDIGKETIPAWRDRLETDYSKRFPDYEFALVLLPHPYNQDDNNLLIVRRPPSPASAPA
jgi:SAM-dependent methyltransferase